CRPCDARDRAPKRSAHQALSDDCGTPRDTHPAGTSLWACCAQRPQNAAAPQGSPDLFRPSALIKYPGLKLDLETTLHKAIKRPRPLHRERRSLKIETHLETRTRKNRGRRGAVLRNGHDDHFKHGLRGGEAVAAVDRGFK